MDRPRNNSMEPMRLYLGIDVDGVREYQSIGLLTLPEKAAPVKDKEFALTEYLIQYESDRGEFSSSTLKGRSDMRKKVEEYLRQAGTPSLPISSVDAEFCRGFIDYLKTARNSVSTKEQKTISKGCAHHHQTVFCAALNKAVKEGYLPSNPMNCLDQREKLRSCPKERDYLTIDELRRMIKQDCGNPEVKLAFLFSCFTGLRLSDVRTLTWADVHKSPDGQSSYIHVFMQKTQKPNNIPLSSQALKCMPPGREADERVFDLPSSDATINYHIKKWARNAGVSKCLSYHCSRHTFATMMLTLGADVYTTSKLLGHSSVTTTAIYAKIVDKKKEATVNLVSSVF